MLWLRAGLDGLKLEQFIYTCRVKVFCNALHWHYVFISIFDPANIFNVNNHCMYV